VTPRARSTGGGGLLEHPYAAVLSDEIYDRMLYDAPSTSRC